MTTEYLFHSHEPFTSRSCGGDAERASQNDSNDHANFLPADPFGMDLLKTSSAMDLNISIYDAITRWIESSPAICQIDAGNLVTGPNFHRNDALISHPFTRVNSTSDIVDISIGGYSESLCCVDERGSFGFPGGEEEVPSSQMGNAIIYGEGGSLQNILFFSLRYLGVQDLLSMERVCRSFRSTIRNDSLLWRCIHIDSPLNRRITDDDLFRLTQNAQGRLQCLSLVVCPRITDDGLKLVLEANPKLEKLSVYGCYWLSIEALIDNLKALKLSGMTGIMTLKLGMHIRSPKHFEELKLLVGTGEPHQNNSHKLQFYHERISSIACESDRCIDIELCPVCHLYTTVFDCPLESCRGNDPNHCRGCISCIERCYKCGRCVSNCKYFETFLIKNICIDCSMYQDY